MVMTVTTLVGIVKKWAICRRMGDGNANLQGLLYLVCLIMNSGNACTVVVLLLCGKFIFYVRSRITFIEATCN